MGKTLAFGWILSGLFGLCACAVDAPSDEDEIRLTLWTQDYWVGVTGHELDGVPLDDPRRTQYTVKDWYNKVVRDLKAPATGSVRLRH